MKQKIIKELKKCVRMNYALKEFVKKALRFLVDCRNKIELWQVKKTYIGNDKNKVWAFCSGNDNKAFRGNPKYLFIYINNYRNDITAYWICEDKNIIKFVRSLGFRAYRFNTPAASFIMQKTGVFVHEQVKGVIPEELKTAKYLNLWHGINGAKKIEKGKIEGRIAKGIACKYIANTEYLNKHELFLMPNHIYEVIDGSQMGVYGEQIIRAGYPRNLYNKYYEKIKTFDHDILKNRNLPSNVRIVVYAPTFRNNKDNCIFEKLIPNIDALNDVCVENNIFFIFKMHPLMEKDFSFNVAKKKYKNYNNLMFWDNKNDFYEILDKTDVLIYDVSSIFTDCVDVGVEKFLRYMPGIGEFDTMDVDTDDRCIGKKLNTFEDLLIELKSIDEIDCEEEVDYIKKTIWEWSGKDSFEKIIEQTLSFVPKDEELKNLYSFDIFDTLISRKVLAPKGIFYKVMEEIQKNGSFPFIFSHNYPYIRMSAETCMRQYYDRTKTLRESELVEIKFDEIFEKIKNVYNITDDKIELLKKWELDAELENAIPCTEQINLVKDLISKNENVVLISDMYLPKERIQKMLAKVEPELSTLPLYVSSEYGVKKTSGQLYFEVYKHISMSYKYKNWIHYGDNKTADHKAARKMNIQVREIKAPKFDKIQNKLVEKLNTYDAYLVAALQARMISKTMSQKDIFNISFAALCLVPYVDWVIRDAIEKGYETLYFMARDGYHLERIADAIIEEKKLNIKTKYFYASRKTVRIQSYINEIDKRFWLPFGNFGNIKSKQNFLNALYLDNKSFNKMFPTVNLNNINFNIKKEVDDLIELVKVSKEYEKYLLSYASKERNLTEGYMRQEINQNENFAFVEFWGRGDTQDNFVTLYNHMTGNANDVPFYYCRALYMTTNNSVRHSFTTYAGNMVIIESMFSNLPYDSVKNYKFVDGKYVPVYDEKTYDKELLQSTELILPEFAKQYVRMGLTNYIDTDRMLYEFILDYFYTNSNDKLLIDNIGKMMFNEYTYASKQEVAPAFDMKMLNEFRLHIKTSGHNNTTKSRGMSYERASEKVKVRYRDMYNLLPEDGLDDGYLLSDVKWIENRKYRKKYNAITKKTKKISKLYNNYLIKNKVTDQIIILCDNKSSKKTLNKLKHLIVNHNLNVKLVYLHKFVCTYQLAKILSFAKYIIMQNPIPILCETHFREETKVIMLPKNAFGIKNIKLASKYELKWKTKYEKLVNDNDIDVLQVPSTYAENNFRTHFTSHNTTTCDLIGNCNTDIYFNDGIDKANNNLVNDNKIKRKLYASTKLRKKFLRMFPSAKNKKILFYMPSFRTENKNPKWANLIDIQKLKKLIGNEYYVIFEFADNVNINKCDNIINVNKFCKELKNKFTTREMMLISDVIVGDYSEIFFESAILNKPVFSTAFDYEKILKIDEMHSYSEYFDNQQFCPIIRTAEELANELANLDNYDYTKMQHFNSVYFSGCDGQSMERVLEYIKGGEK